MLKAILFDLDDTLFDHRYSSRVALSRLQDRFHSHLGGVALDEIEAHNLQILNELHSGVLDGSLSLDDARAKRFNRLLALYGLELDVEDSLGVGKWYRTEYEASWRATPGATELLSSLKNEGYRIGIVTNNLVAEQMQKLDRCGLASLVDSITISEEAGVTKPDARIFEIALERTECSTDEALMVGDSWSNDIIGAQHAGIKAVWYNCYGHAAPDESVPEVRTLEEVPSAIAAIRRESRIAHNALSLS